MLLVLSALNWGLEAFRWKVVMRPLERLSLGRSMKAILSGLSISAFSPNRVGEFVGRVVYLKRANKIRGVLLNFVSNLSLILTTYISGFIASLCFMHLSFDKIEIWMYISILLAGILGLLLIIAYFNLKSISQFASRFRAISKFKSYWSTYSVLTFDRLSYYWMLSIFRYMIFTIQYLIVLSCFSVEIGWFEGIVSIWTIFFIQLVIPSFVLLEVGIRGKAALSVIGFFSQSQPELILASSLALWLINLILPGLIGVYFLLNLNFWKAIKIKW